MRGTAAKGCYSGKERLVVTGRLLLNLFPLHVVTRFGILLYSNEIQQPQHRTRPVTSLGSSQATGMTATDRSI
ncbi:hypothetical protein AAW14_30915 [Streptomyces hygroscopicus]|uniref:hypothetical protein n=1 Tax=Streptomyces hygroscopicus TaxID=1912 RepID=UPI00224033EE|nr:hypothetical protein [Streptomyces hygroscopicus]MCW7946288.1 hypothetical protein [Streptomyces hygroscopicus]